MYALIQNNSVSKYPYSLSQLRRDNPQVSFPKESSLSLLSEYGVTEVLEVLKPAPSNPVTKNIVEVTPVFIGGRWTQVWNEVDASSEEIAERTQAAVNQTDRQNILADTFVPQFISMTPAQVASYISLNVTNLSEAKTVLTKIALMLLLLARREFR